MPSIAGIVPLPTSISAVDGDPHSYDGEPSISAEIDPRASENPEGYRLRVDAGGVRISAPTQAGLFYGRQTLRQLVAQQPGRIDAVEIVDHPRYAYRGMMLDVARHFHSVSTVKAVIERIALLKLNHLHLHLTDDQGWRIEILSRPELTSRGSTSEVGGGPGGFYTQDDYRELVQYAADRFITVVPEFDMPGHTHAVSLAYPELMENQAIDPAVAEQAQAAGFSLPTFGEPYTDCAVGHSSLMTSSPEVYEFVADVVHELAALTPGPYLHLGGDEAHGTKDEDFVAFITRASRIAAATGKTPIGWHEMGTCRDLPVGTIGQFWGLTTDDGRAGEPTRTFVESGGRVILSPADTIYIDMKYTSEDPIGLAWANGPTSVKDSYAWDPDTLIDGISGNDVLGIEAPLWCETVGSLADIDWLTFPRIASAAEIAWSPRDGRSWEDFRERVGAQAPLWRSEGIGFFESPEIDWA